MRKITSELLYSRLLSSADLVSDEKLDDLLALLMETVWDGELTAAVEACQRLFNLLARPIPAAFHAHLAAAQASALPQVEVEATYRDLVKAEHY